MKSLASREVFYACYRIIEHFVYSAFWYCFYDEYEGCLREDCVLSYRSTTLGANYCCVCRTFRHYKFEELEKIKHNSFRLERFYLNLLRDLVEILEVDPTACFWEDKIYYKYREKRVRFANREKDDLWRIYKEINEHSFEVEKIE